MNTINLSLFVNRIDAISGEMEGALQQSLFSPNRRDRLDFSCAVFDVSDDRVLRRRIFWCIWAAWHLPCEIWWLRYAGGGYGWVDDSHDS